MHIRYQNCLFSSVRALVKCWNQAHPSKLPSKVVNVSHNISNWKRKHRGVELTDEIIDQLITPRCRLNVLYYNEMDYGGPTECHKAVSVKNKVTYKAFHLNLTSWKKSNPGQVPNDSDLEKMASYKRVRTADGGYMSPLRKAWENLQNPKLGWAQFNSKMKSLGYQSTRVVPDIDLSQVALPREWMKSPDDPLFIREDGRVATRQQFYDLITGEKCTFTCFSKRIASYKKQNCSLPSEAVVRKLTEPYKYSDLSIGCLYRITHKKSNRVYIGVTSQTFDERMRGHRRVAATGQCPAGSIGEGIHKDGFESFNEEVLAKFIDLDDLLVAEKEAIINYKSLAPKGYNLNPGGTGILQLSTPILLRGKSYKNQTAIAHDYGMPVKRLESRLRLDYSLQRATEFPGILKGRASNPYDLKPDESIKTLADQEGVSSKRVYERLASGWSLEEAFEIIPRDKLAKPGMAKPVFVAEIQFCSQTEACQHFGIKESCFRKRIKLGWSMEEALGIACRNKAKRR